jgi:hypothetical protein
LRHILADEAHHRDVNHTYAGKKKRSATAQLMGHNYALVSSLQIPHTAQRSSALFLWSEVPPVSAHSYTYRESICWSCRPRPQRPQPVRPGAHGKLRRRGGPEGARAVASGPLEVVPGQFQSAGRVCPPK